jgi:hypothetical protein
MSCRGKQTPISEIRTPAGDAHGRAARARLLDEVHRRLRPKRDGFRTKQAHPCRIRRLIHGNGLRHAFRSTGRAAHRFGLSISPVQYSPLGGGLDCASGSFLQTRVDLPQRCSVV